MIAFYGFVTIPAQRVKWSRPFWTTTQIECLTASLLV
jgi:hypothetical protein